MENLETVFSDASIGESGQNVPEVPHSLPLSPISLSRKRSEVERAVLQRLEAAKEFASQLPPQDLPTVNAYIPPMLEKAIFCGHLVCRSLSNCIMVLYSWEASLNALKTRTM